MNAKGAIAAIGLDLEDYQQGSISDEECLKRCQAVLREMELSKRLRDFNEFMERPELDTSPKGPPGLYESPIMKAEYYPKEKYLT